MADGKISTYMLLDMWTVISIPIVALLLNYIRHFCVITIANGAIYSDLVGFFSFSNLIYSLCLLPSLPLIRVRRILFFCLFMLMLTLWGTVLCTSHKSPTYPSTTWKWFSAPNTNILIRLFHILPASYSIVKSFCKIHVFLQYNLL